MTRIFQLSFLSIGICAAALAQEAVPGELIVRVNAASLSKLRSMSQSMGAKVVMEARGGEVVTLKLPSGASVSSAIQKLRSLSGLQYAEPNYKAEALLNPNDPSYGSQWGPPKISCPTAWDTTMGSNGVTIAIIDTGVDLDHPDLSAKIVPGYDFVNGDSIPDDDNGHGTHCAGISAAITNNSLGIAGVAGSCSVMPVKVLDGSGSGSYSNIISGIYWAADHGANVISMSLGGSSGSSGLLDALNYAWGKGVVIVAAAGNNNSSTPMYPGYYSVCVAVGSTDSNDNKSSFSNFGDWVDVAAPGSSIYSTYPNGYATMSGTSMATPHVAGLAGLLWADMGTDSTPAAIRSRIESTCDPIGSWLAHGRINCASALDGDNAPPLYRTDFVPSTYTVLRGRLRRGGLERLATSDNKRFELVGEVRGTPRALHVEFSAFVTYAGDLNSLEVKMEGILVPVGDLPIWLWDFTQSTWVQFSSLSLARKEQTVSFQLSESATNFIGPDGEVRVKIYRELPRSSSVLKIDKLCVTTVATAGG